MIESLISDKLINDAEMKTSQSGKDYLLMLVSVADGALPAAALLRRLAHNGEADQSTIAELLARCEQDTGTRAYFVGRAAEDPTPPTCEAYEEWAAIMEFDAGLSRPEAEHAAALDVGCVTCAHHARPGLSDGYCGGRDGLPRAYGENHPLRKLPSDKGATCKEWRANQ